MNKRQRLSLQIGGLLLAAVILFPPWERTERMGNGLFAQGMEIQRTSSEGYHFLFMPPDSSPASDYLADNNYLETSVGIAWSKLGVRLLALGGILATVLLLFRKAEPVPVDEQ